MAIQGQLPYGVGLTNSMPTGLFGLLGEDGNHYIIAHHFFASPAFWLSKIDTNEPDYYTATEANFQADFAALGLPTVVAANIMFYPYSGFGVTGTAFYFIQGVWKDGSGHYKNIALRYKINSSGVPVVDGYFVAGCNFINSGPLGNKYSLGSFGADEVIHNQVGYVWGSQVIGDDVYIVYDSGVLYTFGSTQYTHLARLPLTGSVFDLTDGAMDAYITLMPWEPKFLNTTSDARGYANQVSIVDNGSDKVTVLVYKNPFTFAAYSVTNPGNSLYSATFYDLKYVQMLSDAVVYTIADVSAHSNTGSNVGNTAFGLSFADNGKNKAGATDTAQTNYYTAPTVIGQDLFFMRGYSDALNYANYRRCQLVIVNDVITNVVYSDTLQAIYTSVSPSGLSGTAYFIQGWRIGATFYTMGRFDSQYVFGDVGAYPVTVSTKRPWICVSGR